MVLSPLTGNSNDDRVLPWKRKQLQMTATAVQKKRIEDLKQKRHKSDEHKAVVWLYLQEKEKVDGMSLRHVEAVIRKKYGVGPSRTTIVAYAKEGLVNVSPKKMGPAENVSEHTYALLCMAFSSMIPIQ